jgi:hypothetical protein
MKTTVKSALQAFCQSASENYGLELLNYGEAVESLTANQAGNYVTLDGSNFCAVDDNFRLVFFVVRESSKPTDQKGGGMNRILSREVSFTLAANSINPEDEYIISSLLNRTTGISYDGSSHDSKTIARNYFGLEERQFETSFFTCSFTALETITCLPC